MNSNTSIYQELKETTPRLANIGNRMPHAIPQTYFQHFYATLANRLFPEEMLLQAPKKVPYTVPNNYFAQLYPQLSTHLTEPAINQAIEDELTLIAPLLAQVPKKMPYSVPAKVLVHTPKTNPQATIVSFATSIRWWYATAACLVTIMLLAGIWRYQKVQQHQQVAKAEIGVRINQLSDAELANYLLNESALPANTDMHDMANIPVDALFNLQEHLQMCTDEELNAFLKENELATSKHKVSKGG
jgi:hypothetical protein